MTLQARIAVDAMGGDFAPYEIVDGAVEAAKGLSDISSIILVGDKAKIEKELERHKEIPGKIHIFHASETVEMAETPALAIRKKKDNSISRAMDLVKKGEADAALSAGNTGAMVVAATLKLRTLEGIERPAIATPMPTPEKPFILIDAGANTDCTASMLAQFAVMGHVYSKELFKIEKPLIGLMSVGTEETKGNEITKEAFQILSNSKLNFKGNIEGHDLFEGKIDVVVCDGFVGNVILKTSESVAHAVGKWIKKGFFANPIRALGALLLRGALKDMKRHMDPELYGGAPLLGVNGTCIISHGASSSRAIYHAIRTASESLQRQVNSKIQQAIKELL